MIENNPDDIYKFYITRTLETTQFEIFIIFTNKVDFLNVNMCFDFFCSILILVYDTFRTASAI